jgi:hypothetical protein
LIGIDVVRWVFQPAWPGLGWPDGLLMVRTEVKASGESGAGFEKVVTMIAPGVWMGPQKGRDRRIANTRDGKPVWIRPRRGVREGAPAARRPLYQAPLGGQNVGLLVDSALGTRATRVELLRLPVRDAVAGYPALAERDPCEVRSMQRRLFGGDVVKGDIVIRPAVAVDSGGR